MVPRWALTSFLVSSQLSLPSVINVTYLKSVVYPTQVRSYYCSEPIKNPSGLQLPREENTILQDGIKISHNLDNLF